MRVAEFYADPKRAGSEELAFGSSWRSQGEGPWKVVWLETTGELVAVNESHRVRAVVSDPLAEVKLAADVLERGAKALWTERDGAYADEVVIIAVEPDLFRVRGALIGWEDHMREENGLAWLAARADELAPRHAD